MERGDQLSGRRCGVAIPSRCEVPVNPIAELMIFAGLMAMGQFSPGPDMLLLTRTSLRHGAFIGIKMAAGIACGLAIHATIAIGGMSWIVQSNEVIWTLLRVAASAYLVWLCWRILRQIRNAAATDELLGERMTTPFLRGLFCNLTNLKAVLFFAAIVAPFMAGDRSQWWPYALWIVIVFQALVLWSLWAMLLQRAIIKSFYQKFGCWIDAWFALALFAIAIRLLLF